MDLRDFGLLGLSLVFAVPFLGCEKAPDAKPVADQAAIQADANSPPMDDATRSEKYKTLAAEYYSLGAKKSSSDGDLLRHRLSELCEEIVKRKLPLGVSRDDVIRELGPAAGSAGTSALFYYGKETGWFHDFEFRDGRLAGYDHGFITDLEGGK